MAKYDRDEAEHKIVELEADVGRLENRIAILETLLKQAETTIVRQQKELSYKNGH